MSEQQRDPNDLIDSHIIPDSLQDQPLADSQFDKKLQSFESQPLKSLLNNLKNESYGGYNENQLRKESLQEGEMSCQDVDEKVSENSSQINMMTLQNKNPLMDFKIKDHVKMREASQLKLISKPSEGSGMLCMDKRCRSETPNKMSATDVLYRAHKKLQHRRKLSPSKLMERHELRQRKAMEVRAQIESSRKALYNQLRSRQRVIKNRWNDMLATKKAKLFDKLEQAEERRESEIQSLKNKAKSELQKIDETNLIMKLTMDNMKIDLDLKMSETQERRNQILEEYKQKQMKIQQKMEAAEKRRQEQKQEFESKLQSNKQKRELAEARRNQVLKDKIRVAEGMTQREKIIQRKHELGDKISDYMSFISNSENIWDFLSNELEWSDQEQEGQMYELMAKDHYEREKTRMKKDAEILNQLIIISEEGQIFARKELLSTALKKFSRRKQEVEDYSYGVEDDEEELKEGEKYSPAKNQQILDAGYYSDYSDVGSMKSEENTKSLLGSQFGVNMYGTAIPTEEDLSYQLYSIRVKMSMKRNILKKNLSEDLTWTDFLKNDYYFRNHFTQNPLQPTYNRSLHSTPERKHDIPSESEKEQEPVHSSMSSQDKLNVKKVSQTQFGLNIGVKDSNSSNSQSDKSRISQQVYPSKKKKNPKNIKGQNQNTNSDLKSNGSQKSNKKLTSIGSNSSLANQLMTQSNQGSFLGSDFPFKEQNWNLHRKSTQLEVQDSERKKFSSRMHSSSVQESSHSLMPFAQASANAILTNLDGIQQNSYPSEVNTHTGTQMTQLITNNRPQPPSTKIVPKKLTTNAVRLLFPIREQKLLFKRSGKEGQFGKCKISVKIDDLQKIQAIPISISGFDKALIEGESKTMNETTSSSRKSLQSTPSGGGNRRQSIDQQQQPVVVQNESVLNNTPNQISRLQQQHQKIMTGLNFESKIPKITGSKMGSNLPSENSPSPRKDLEQVAFKQLLDESIIVSLATEQSQNFLNEQCYRELILKLLMTDNICLLKNEDDQKTIVFDSAEGDKVIEYLEQHELSLRYCRICEMIVPDSINNESHIQLKTHKRARDELSIKECEDQQFSMFTFYSVPGDIEKELIKEKEKALKRKVKRIKTQMISSAESHESATYCPGKEITSVNKKRFQLLCVDLEKQVIPIINNYDLLENTLKEIIKILETRKPGDLHVMRKLKFIPVLMEICKRITVCHKSDYKYLGKVLEFVIKLINLFCGLRENRNYMLQTNRLSPLIELLIWCLNRKTQLFYGITFMPQLFHILTSHIKHRVPYECQVMKEFFIEYLVCSSITTKIKQKLQIINGPLDFSEMLGQVPLFLLKSVTFLEALTSLLSADAKIRPVYDKSSKIGEQLFFVIQNNDLFGIIQMITTILLSRNHTFKPSGQNQTMQITKILPQTILSLAIISIKIINNVFRMDYRFAQQLMADTEIQEHLYHLFNYLLVYGGETQSQQEDSKELLHETILMIGYFALSNDKNQHILCRGENTIFQKLCNLPFPYFCNKKLKEILFPTLIAASYKNERSLAIMDQEISIELIVDYLQMNIKEELPKIIEEDIDNQSMSSLGIQGGNLERKQQRSPSLSSTNSSNKSFQVEFANGNSPYLPLLMRFPKRQWKDGITFYSKVL